MILGLGTGTILVISIAIALTVAIAAFVLAPRLFEPRVVFDKTPDVPAPFGYRMAWIAVRSTDRPRIAEVLHLTPIDTANWSTGIGTIYDTQLSQGRVYMTPSIEGWTFVVGLALPQPLGRAFADKCTPMMLDLAGAFPEAHYFLSYAPLDFYAWVRVAEGKLTRAFAVGDEGIIWNKGRPTREEKTLRMRFAEVRTGKAKRAEEPLAVYPSEAQVMALAGAWGLDPTDLPDEPSPDGVTGYVCAAPQHWMAERLRRSA